MHLRSQLPSAVLVFPFLVLENRGDILLFPRVQLIDFVLFFGGQVLNWDQKGVFTRPRYKY